MCATTPKKKLKKKPLLLVHPTQKNFKVNKLSLLIYMTITIFHNFQIKNDCCLIRQVCICNLNCFTMTITTFSLQYSKHPFNDNLVGVQITNGFKIKTMYVYYIIVKNYVFVYINIFSPFYCLCIISMLHHYLTMDFT